MGCGHLFHYFVEVEAARLLARREFAEALQRLRDITTGRREHEHALGHPVRPVHTLFLGAFEGVHAQVFDQRCTQFLEGVAPDVKSSGGLFQEGDLPIVVAQRCDAAIVGPVKELVPWPRTLALEKGEQIVAIEVHLEGRGAYFLALYQDSFHRGIPRSPATSRDLSSSAAP